jgi:hypothetical protein
VYAFSRMSMLYTDESPKTSKSCYSPFVSAKDHLTATTTTHHSRQPFTRIWLKSSSSSLVIRFL